MATTANGTPYVESSDLVANYPAVSLALAEHIDDLPSTILQVVRATDTTNRTTTSSSYVDVTGMTVTITPNSDTSNVMILAIFAGSASNPSSTTLQAFYQITVQLKRHSRVPFVLAKIIKNISCEINNYSVLYINA